MTPNEMIEGEDGDISVEKNRFSIEEKVDELIATAAEVRQKLRVRNILFCIAGVLFAIMVAFCSVVLLGLRHQASDLKAIAVSNNNNGKDIKSVIDSINAATGADARARSAIATTEVIRRNVIEGDCRMRRVQARMAAPDPAASCESQTPANIYPGLDGEPPR